MKDLSPAEKSIFRSERASKKGLDYNMKRGAKIRARSKRTGLDYSHIPPKPKK